MKITNGYLPAYITLSAVVIIIAVLLSINPSAAVAMIKDDGLVQIMSCVFLGSGFFLALLRVISKTPPVLKWAEASYMLSIYAMREMDFHRLFTQEHVTRLRMYTGPFPLEEKLIGGTIMLLFIAVTLHFAATNVSIFLKNLKAKTPWAVYIAVWFFLLAGAQFMDKPRLLRKLGSFNTITEETMELGAALMIFFIMLSFPFDVKKLFRRGRP